MLHIHENKKDPPSEFQCSRGQETQVFQTQISALELQRGGETKVIEEAADPEVVEDAKTTMVEVTDANTEAIGIDIGTSDVDVSEQVLASGFEVADDGVDHHLGLGRFLVGREELLLLVPGLIR